MNDPCLSNAGRATLLSDELLRACCSAKLGSDVVRIIAIGFLSARAVTLVSIATHYGGNTSLFGHVHARYPRKHRLRIFILQNGRRSLQSGAPVSDALIPSLPRTHPPSLGAFSLLA